MCRQFIGTHHSTIQQAGKVPDLAMDTNLDSNADILHPREWQYRGQYLVGDWNGDDHRDPG